MTDMICLIINEYMCMSVKSKEVMGSSEDEGPHHLHVIDEADMRSPADQIVQVPK